MKAEDTVMTLREINEYLINCSSIMTVDSLYELLSILTKKQAEISFRAGIQQNITERDGH